MTSRRGPKGHRLAGCGAARRHRHRGRARRRCRRAGSARYPTTRSWPAGSGSMAHYYGPVTSAPKATTPAGVPQPGL